MQRHRLSILTTLPLLLLLLLLAPASANEKAQYSDGPLLGLRKPRAHYEGRFQAWMERFGVRVEAHEYLRRLRIWADNDDHIHAHNHQRTNASYTLGHNAYSHLMLEEFHARFKLGRHAPRLYRPHAQPVPHIAEGEGYDPSFAAQVAAVRLRGAAQAPENDDSLPAEVDWVAAGVVTDVKDQGMCGSCWAFSTTGAVEGAYAIKTGTLLSFSEQELVDCDDNDFGCNGGLMDQAFTYLESSGGLALEADYPYEAVSGRCKLVAVEAVEGTEVTGYTDVTPDSEQALKAAVAKQPVSIAIEADERDFQLYASGVFSAECGTNLDHGVLAVGYGVDADSGLPYWKVKNSWGPSWGNEGYILLQRGAGITQEGGQCGILLAASYPSL